MPESLLFSGDHPAATLNRLVTSGRALRIAPGIYTTDTASPPERTVRRNWHRILGHLYPKGVVVADRSAATPAPVQNDGRLYVVTPGLRRPMPITLPGMTVVPRPGVGPIGGDAPMVEGKVWLASRARALVENQRPSRARSGPTCVVAALSTALFVTAWLSPTDRLGLVVMGGAAPAMILNLNALLAAFAPVRAADGRWRTDVWAGMAAWRGRRA